ncbi:uncharacterized protein [Littorina saxatilis]|uniref:Uncharacterized protein n=1 Tax=Littorina saxatilis TaxID=31220 RepID=A0AAN9AZN4_9CAEN
MLDLLLLLRSTLQLDQKRTLTLLDLWTCLRCRCVGFAQDFRLFSGTGKPFELMCHVAYTSMHVANRCGRNLRTFLLNCTKDEQEALKEINPDVFTKDVPDSELKTKPKTKGLESSQL